MISESVLTSDAVAAGGQSQFVARFDTRMVSRGLSAMLRRGDLEVVLEFLGDVEKLRIRPSTLFDEVAEEALAVECRRLVHRGRVEEFVQVMETLAGYQFYIKNIVDPVDILKIFVGKRDPKMAVRYASVLPHSQLLFCSIIHEFGKKKDLASALNAYEEFKQKSGGFNMFACRSIIDVCGFCGDSKRSRAIFNELLSEKITPNTYVCNSLMNVNAHDLSYTLYVYKKMQSLGITVDVASYNILLKACCLAKRVDLAQDIYKEIKHMASTRAIELDVITYSTMIKAFADAKMWQMALNIKEDMILAGVSPNVVTWSSLISACANAGLVDQAIQVFEEMLLAGCEPNSQCCNVLLYACVEACQYDRAFRFLNLWKETGFKIFCTTNDRESDDTHGSPSSMADSGPPQLTDFTHNQTLSFVKVVPFRPTTATYNILMKACGTDYHHAKDLMDEMKVMGLSPNHISWSVLINICGSSQNMRGALQAFKSMRDIGIKPDVIAYTTAIKACAENKNLKIAFSLFEEMKRYHLQPNLVTYNTLLRARTKYGSLHEVRQCLAIYQDMRKAGYSSNDYFLKELLEEWCEGVICSSYESRGPLGPNHSCNGADRSNPQSLLLEKVAMHLQKDINKNQAIDLRGLTKVEARIVVLSVLRMIKENYELGHPITDDMIIITGVSADHEREVKHAIIRVLKDDLGLDVLVGLGTVPVQNDVVVDPPNFNAKSSTVLQKTELQKEYTTYPRRPQDLGRLMVSRTSLYNWLQKKHKH